MRSIRIRPSIRSFRGKSTATAAAKQDSKTEDMVPMDAFKHDIWYSSTGWKRPSPGDSKVLLPSQIPGADSKITSDPDGNS
jgi:hypothetical protein